jgi:zinc transport system substrate-binding protein
MKTPVAGKPFRCRAVVPAWRAVACLPIFAGTAGCVSEVPDGKLRVVVTVAPLAGFVDRVAPGLADITILIPPGASPVTYEPTLSDRRAMARAELYVETGHPAFTWERTWLADLADREGADRVVAAAACEVAPEDPHVWFSTSCARSMATTIAGSLGKARPEQREEVERALAGFAAVIDSVDEETIRRLAPHRGEAFLVLHPAWGYLARRHGLEQIAILEHGSGDAGPARLAAIVTRARAEGLTNVFVQPQFSNDPARLVARELGGRTVTLDPLARDWEQSMRRTIDALATGDGP